MKKQQHIRDGLYKHEYYVKDKTTGEQVLKESENWYHRFHRNGKSYIGSTGCSNRTHAVRYVEKLKRDIDVKHALGDTKAVTIKVAIETYLDTIKGTSKYKMVNMRLAKMLGSMKDKRTQKIISVWGFDGNRQFDSLTDADVQQFIIERRKLGNSNGTILTELAALSQVVILTKKLGFLIPSIDFAELKKDNKVRPSKGRLRYLTKDEEDLLLYHLDPNNDQVGTGGDLKFAQRQDAYDLAVLLLDIGGRYSEIAHLKWTDIDLAAKSVSLWRSKVNNESVLNLTKRSLTVLARRAKAKRDDQVFVFEAKDGSARNYSPGAFQSAFARAKLVGCTIHTIRHTFASKLVQNGVTTHELQSLLGHSSPTTTAIYAHLSPSQVSGKATDILNNL
jgi:integrase